MLSATYTFINEWSQPSCLYSPAAAHHRTLAPTYFLSHRGYEAELAWVAGDIPRLYARPKTVTQYQPTDSAATRDRTHDY